VWPLVNPSSENLFLKVYRCPFTRWKMVRSSEYFTVTTTTPQVTRRVSPVTGFVKYKPRRSWNPRDVALPQEQTPEALDLESVIKKRQMVVGAGEEGLTAAERFYSLAA
jgi:hypothetical protein